MLEGGVGVEPGSSVLGWGVWSANNVIDGVWFCFVLFPFFSIDHLFWYVKFYYLIWHLSEILALATKPPLSSIVGFHLKITAWCYVLVSVLSTLMQKAQVSRAQAFLNEVWKLFCKEILKKKLRGKWMVFSSFNTTCTPIRGCVQQAHIVKFLFFRFIFPKDKQTTLLSKAYCFTLPSKTLKCFMLSLCVFTSL